jgi:hypothetical protein
MSDKMEKPQSKGGGTPGRTELAVVVVLLVTAVTASVVMTDSSKWDSSRTAIGTTVHW